MNDEAQWRIDLGRSSIRRVIDIVAFAACYGIVTVPTGPWYCRKCESQERSARVVRKIVWHRFLANLVNLLKTSVSFGETDKVDVCFVRRAVYPLRYFIEHAFRSVVNYVRVEMGLSRELTKLVGRMSCALFIFPKFDSVT